jgi:hypothetical protein
MKARPLEVYDQDGNLQKIEVTLENGTHLFDAQWDPNDEQNEKNRIAFREWTRYVVDQQGHTLT